MKKWRNKRIKKQQFVTINDTCYKLLKTVTNCRTKMAYNDPNSATNFLKSVV